MLSGRKLLHLLESNGFTVFRCFADGDELVLLECVSIMTAARFFLTLNGLRISSPPTKKIHRIQEIHIPDTSTRSDFYKSNTNTNGLQGSIHIAEDSGDVESRMNQYYNHKITINDVDVDDSGELKRLYRQLKRLGSSVSDIEYKFCCIFKRYIGVTLSDNSIKFYVVQDYNSELSYARLMVGLPLGYAFDHFDTIDSNITMIRSEVSTMVERNQQRNLALFDEFTAMANEIGKELAKCVESRKNHIDFVQKWVGKLSSVNDSLKQAHLKLRDLKVEYENNMATATYSRILSLENEISILQKNKNTIVQNLNKYNDMADNQLLTADRLVFDNVVMIETVVKNAKALMELNQSKNEGKL